MNTIKYLQPSQLVAGLRWRARLRSRDVPVAKLRFTAISPGIQRAVANLGVEPLRNPVQRADEIVRHRFEFLNTAHHLETLDWTRQYVNRLWTYNLHYFDYSLDLALAFHQTGERQYIDEFESLALSWIRSTSPKTPNAWDPYPISLRTVNWLYSLALIGDGLGRESREAILQSVEQQLTVLDRSVEWHILGNHVLKNLKALVVGAVILRLPDTVRRNRASNFWRELRAQVNDDGGHYEASPMYHAIVLGDALAVANLLRDSGESLPPDVTVLCKRMLDALTRLSREDGSLRLLNDSARGEAPSLNYLRALAARIQLESELTTTGQWSLASTGYFGYRDDRNDADIVVACREPSPAFQPGHSHADILSFELDVNRIPVIVDSGVHGYDGDIYREYVRSTRAHNTVVIAGRDQSEQWATFRFARRASNVGGSSNFEGGVFTFEGSYRPFHAQATTHRRTMRLERAQLLVTDSIANGDDALVESFLHFHPDFALTLKGNRAVACRNDLEVIIEPFGTDSVAILHGERQPVQGWYCEEFGKAAAQDVLVMRIERQKGKEFGYRITWKV